MTAKTTGSLSKSQRLKIVAVILGILWITLAITFKPWEPLLPPEERLEKIWMSDFEKLRQGHSLPAGFYDLKSVDYQASGPRLRSFITKYRKPNFGIKTNGHYRLEVFMDVTESGGVMMQYDLIDERGNTIWELGRTFNQNLFGQNISGQKLLVK